jgi:hypothetical protein
MIDIAKLPGAVVGGSVAAALVASSALTAAGSAMRTDVDREDIPLGIALGGAGAALTGAAAGLGYLALTRGKAPNRPSPAAAGAISLGIALVTNMSASALGWSLGRRSDAQTAGSVRDLAGPIAASVHGLDRALGTTAPPRQDAAIQKRLAAFDSYSEHGAAMGDGQLTRRDLYLARQAATRGTTMGPSGRDVLSPTDGRIDVDRAAAHLMEHSAIRDDAVQRPTATHGGEQVRGFVERFDTGTGGATAQDGVLSHGELEALRGALQPQ